MLILILSTYWEFIADTDRYFTQKNMGRESIEYNNLPVSSFSKHGQIKLLLLNTYKWINNSDIIYEALLNSYQLISPCLLELNPSVVKSLTLLHTIKLLLYSAFAVTQVILKALWRNEYPINVCCLTLICLPSPTLKYTLTPPFTHTFNV